MPAGSFFLVGDNPEAGADSRYRGFVARDKILGRPVLIYWSAGGGSPRWARIGRRPR